MTPQKQIIRSASVYDRKKRGHQKFEEALSVDENLRNKYEAALKKIADEKLAESDCEAMVKAAKELGFEISIDEMERYFASIQELDDEELENADTTLLQFTEGSHVTYGAEECGHEYGLKCGVQAELHNAHGTKNYMKDSEDKTSDYRCRDAVASQKLNPSNQHTANQQHYYCECECLIHIKL